MFLEIKESNNFIFLLWKFHRELLGVFASGHTFNDQPRQRNLIEGKPIYLESAPSIAEMSKAALSILALDPDGFLAVIEEEGTDNLGNSMNAAGKLAPEGEHVGATTRGGGILLRAAGFNSDRVEQLMDNTDIYSVMYRTLFGVSAREQPAPAQ